MEPVEVITEEGILRFDGTVLEVFGFGLSFSNRFHVKHLNTLEKMVKRGRIVLDIAGHGSMVIFLPLKSENQLDEFISAVKTMAPNLE